MNIGFIGTGVIATALIHGIAPDDHHILITERSRANSNTLTSQYPNVKVADGQTIVDNSDVVIVCVLADTAKSILPTLTFQAHHRVFSVIVGIDYAEFQTLVQPAAESAIFIPFPFIAQGDSPLLVYPQSDTLHNIFGTRNYLLPVPTEEALNSYLAAQAILSPTIKILHEATTWLAKRTGDLDTAERFIRILVGGYLTAADFEQTAVLPTMLRDLNTTGGLNAQLRSYFATHHIYDAVQSGLDELEDRLNDQ